MADDAGAPADAAQVKDESTTSEASASNDETAAAEDEEPKRLEIWRQNRDNKARGGAGQRRGSNQNRGAKGANFDRKSGKPKHGKFNKQDNRNRKPKQAVEKPIDPASPFAALAALKGDLKAKK